VRFAIGRQAKQPAEELAKELLTGCHDNVRATAQRVDLSEAGTLAQLFFCGSWCHRRVVKLRFVAQRRGHWQLSVDFTGCPEFLEVGALREGSQVLVPLSTFSKDILPRAQIATVDEQEHALPIANTWTSRVAACMAMMWLAEKAGVWSTAVDLLGRLTDTDPRVSAYAFDELERGLSAQQRTLRWDPSLIYFANAARLFRRSVILMAAFEPSVVEKRERKIATLTFDAPIRLTRTLRERLGWEPLRVAPLTIFGGDAHSYHAELEPPEGVVVVDTRLLYSYTARECAMPSTCRDGFQEDSPDETLTTERPGRRQGGSATVRPLPPAQLRHGWRRRWGFVLGSAEPMPAHVRVGNKRLPRMIDGRDAVAMFHVYPDVSAFAGLFVAACADFAYVLGLFLALVLPGGFDADLNASPEPIFLLGVLVAGFGSGLALYNKEHILTSQVALPWRMLFGCEVAAVVGSLIALLMSTHDTPHEHIGSATKVTLTVMCFVAAVSTVYLAIISRRAWVAQRTARRPTSRQGYFLRRQRFVSGYVPDVVDTGTGHAFDAKLDDKGQRKTIETMRKHAQQYLDEHERRLLFNKGVPPASRHDPGSRGA
jgi:hypothetical protein